eukprot:11196685-Lingulodinium_polyedra.AAC.1
MMSLIRTGPATCPRRKTSTSCAAIRTRGLCTETPARERYRSAHEPNASADRTFAPNGRPDARAPLPPWQTQRTLHTAR